MKPRAHQHRIVLLTTSFRHPARRLLFTRARLFPDRIELSGWYPGASYEQVLFLDRIQRIEWHTDEKASPNVHFHMDDGAALSLDLQAPDKWQHTLMRRLGWTPRRERAPLARLGNMGMEDLIAYTSGMS